MLSTINVQHVKLKDITDNRSFKKTVRSFFSGNCEISSSIILNEKEQSIINKEKNYITFIECISDIPKGETFRVKNNPNFRNEESFKLILQNLPNETFSFKRVNHVKKGKRCSFKIKQFYGIKFLELIKTGSWKNASLKII